MSDGAGPIRFSRFTTPEGRAREIRLGGVDCLALDDPPQEFRL